MQTIKPPLALGEKGIIPRRFAASSESSLAHT